MTIFAEANVEVDLRMLRSFRVLRPLKLVSRIPSKFDGNIRKNETKSICRKLPPLRSLCLFFLYTFLNPLVKQSYPFSQQLQIHIIYRYIEYRYRYRSIYLSSVTRRIVQAISFVVSQITIYTSITSYSSIYSLDFQAKCCC